MEQDINKLIESLTSGDDCRAEDAVTEVAEQGEKGLPILQELLANPDPDVRWWATWALSKTGLPQTADLLRTLLHDPNTEVRQCAALAIRQAPDPKAIPDLVAALSDEDNILRRLAGAALSAIGSEAVDPLLEVMENGPQPARLEAVRALAMIGDQRSIPALFAALQKDSALMEYWAAEGLERMGVGMTFFKT